MGRLTQAGTYIQPHALKINGLGDLSGQANFPVHNPNKPSRWWLSEAGRLVVA